MTDIFEHGYAVVVGVDENNITRLALPAVARDVQAVRDVLVHPQRCAYRPEHVQLLKGEESTRGNILDALILLEDQVKGDPQATAVIYYSGHGMVDKTTGQYYLVPYDVPSLRHLRARAIKAEELTDTIGNIQAKRLLVILDCCHAAGMDVKDVDVQAIGEEENVVSWPFPIDLPQTRDIPPYEADPDSKAVSDLLDGAGRAILNSSSGVQKSYLRRDGAMSLFTYHLIEALSGHAPHADDAKVVYVTDVMSWVTHEVKKSAAREQRDQTPVMRTSGVFPVAQLIGGKGLAKGVDAPRPEDPLPPVGTAVTFNQEGQTVHGSQVNIGGDAQIGQIGNRVNTGGGDYVGRNKVIHGDEVKGDKVLGDKVGGDEYSIGDISNSSGVAIGPDASATVSSSTYQGGSAPDLVQLFAPLQIIVAQKNPVLSGKMHELQAQVTAAGGADDQQLAGLIADIAEGVPAAKPALVTLFQNPATSAAAAGPATQFQLSRLG